MGRVPLGVAIGVSGLAHTQSVHPRGQVPSVASRQVGVSELTGPCRWQHSCPLAHHVPPQQTVSRGPNSAVHSSFVH